MKIAKIRKDWPPLEPPLYPVRMTVLDVLGAPEGSGRETRIRQWMAAVWESWADRQQWVRETTDSLLESPERGRSRSRR